MHPSDRRPEDFHLLVVRLGACHERKIRILAKLRSHYPYQWQKFEVSNQDMKYPYRCARTVERVPVGILTNSTHSTQLATANRKTHASTCRNSYIDMYLGPGIVKNRSKSWEIRFFVKWSSDLMRCTNE